MKKFTDTAGGEWPVVITVDTIKRVRGEINVDLLEIVGGKLIAEICADPVLLCDIAYAICKPEADKRGLDSSGFGSLLSGDVIEAAGNALMQELIDFFPQPKRQLLEKAFRKMQEIEIRGMELAETKLADPEMDKHLETMLEQSIASSMSSPE